MLRALRNARIPLFLHRKSNHIFTVWQHIVLLVMIRQYEGKRSYRMFVDWLVEEAYYLRIALRLSYIYTTLHHSSKVCCKNKWYYIGKIISSFILSLIYIDRLFIGIGSSGFKVTNALHYYTDKAKLHNKYLKLSLSAHLLSQIICTSQNKTSSHKT